MSDLSKDEIEKIKKEVTKKVSESIRITRIEKGLSQSELGSKISSDRQYMYKIESGKVGLSVSKLATIAHALDVPISKLLP